MRYDIRLTLDHSYPAASDHARNLLRLLPSDGPNQRILRRLLTIVPHPNERRDWQDYFGNVTTLVAWHIPVCAIRFEVSVQAERWAGSAMDISTPLRALGPEIVAAGLSSSAPLHYRPPSPRIGPSAAIARFAQAQCHQAYSTREAVEALGRALHDLMRFDPTATEVTTPPAEAFAARRGVCQDYAQIMICGLRAVGIPAGYVSGFIRTTPPPGQKRLEGVDAMHGWVMAWCGATQGWLEYDPTNAQWAGEDYITTAIGRDYADAAPVRGAVRTAGGQQTKHAVDMIPLQAAYPAFSGPEISPLG
ncbi:MAG: transglutaminase family protein [Roseinatronobacter sp.]|nr:transglutaminase family protein [Roseinatronobacter sp.]